METSLKAKLDQLKNSGAESFVDKHSDANASKEVVEGEEQQNPIASSVVGASQVRSEKPKQVKRKKNSVMPIPDHEIKRQRKNKR